MKSPLLLLLLSSTLLFSQAKPPHETITIGFVDLRLGMGEDAVIALLTRNDLTLKKSGDGYTVTTERKRGDFDLHGFVGFKNKHLNFVSVNWLHGSEMSDMFTAMYGAIRKVTRDKAQYCEVQTGSQNNPNGESKAIFITCRANAKEEHYIHVDATPYQGQQIIGVTEILREIPTTETP